MKKAFAWFEGKGIEYVLHDYRKDGVPADRLARWIAEFGWEAIVNTRGTTFRKLPAARQEGLNDRKAAALLQEFPSAIRRPIAESGRKTIVGFEPERYAATFK